MAKRVISVLLVALLLMGLLTACGDDTFDVDDAKKLVCDDLGIKVSDADSLDTHLTTEGSVACYVIYVSFDGQHWQYTVNGLTGEILEKTQNASGHTH
jgi:hypothetical protein